LVCDEIGFDRSLLLDIPDVVVDEERGGVQICGSIMWERFDDLHNLFVGILSHESIHLTLIKEVDGYSSDRLDIVASLSAISQSLADVPLIGKYSHGLVGIELD
jgi:hypothetical protein